MTQLNGAVPGAMPHRQAVPRGSGWRLVPMLMPYLWEYRWRVAAALACLIAAKLANVGVPLVPKEAGGALDPTRAAIAVPFGLLLAHGLPRRGPPAAARH